MPNPFAEQLCIEPGVPASVWFAYLITNFVFCASRVVSAVTVTVPGFMHLNWNEAVRAPAGTWIVVGRFDVPVGTADRFTTVPFPKAGAVR